MFWLVMFYSCTIIIYKKFPLDLFQVHHNNKTKTDENKNEDGYNG